MTAPACRNLALWMFFTSHGIFDWSEHRLPREDRQVLTVWSDARQRRVGNHGCPLAWALDCDSCLLGVSSTSPESMNGKLLVGLKRQKILDKYFLTQDEKRKVISEYLRMRPINMAIYKFTDRNMFAVLVNNCAMKLDKPCRGAKDCRNRVHRLDSSNYF